MASLKKQIRNTTLLDTPSKSDIIPSVLLMLAGRAGVLGVFPFGTAFFAACFNKSTAYLGITVLYLSLLSADASGVAVKYMMSALIFWLFINLYRRGSKTIEAVACGGAVFISGVASMFYTFSGLYDVFVLFVESVISGIMYAIFSNSHDIAVNKRRAISQEEILSVAATVGVFILGLGKTNLPYDICVSNIITVYVILIAALNSDIPSSALVGLVLGFITGGKSAILMMGAFGMSAVFASFLKTAGRFGAAFGFLGGACAVLLYSGASEQLPYSVYDVLIAASLFAVTPNIIQKKFSVFIGEGVKIEAENKTERLRCYFSDKLNQYAKSFYSLEQIFLRTAGKRMEMSSVLKEDIYSEAAGRVCYDCPRRSKCWDKDSSGMCDDMLELVYILEQNGRLEKETLPYTFRDKCMRAERIMYEIEHSYELFRIGLAHDGERLSNRDAIAAQYHETAEILEELSKEAEIDFCSEAEEEAVRALERIGITVYEISITEGSRTDIYIRLSDNSRTDEVSEILSEILGINIGFNKSEGGALYFVSKPEYAVEIGTKQISKEDICGDSIRVFGTDKYKLYCIICDGMGVGKKAGIESNTTADLLQEFLTAGFSIRTAVELVNSSMCMRTEEDSFTTLDLLCVDLMNGTAEFYKVGAAQSISYSNGETETVFSAAFPIGTAPYTEVLPQIRRIEDGEIILMASDGITEAGEIKTEWLRKRIKTPFLSMQSMAEEIAAHALKRNGGNIIDDMSVVTVKITSNV